MKKILICFLYFLSSSVQAVDFNHVLNHSNGAKINQLKVFGERCSGTNFITHLIHRNIYHLKSSGHHEFGHKHFPWWIGMPYDEGKLQRLHYSSNAVDFNGSNQCLFVVIVRDPYDWLRGINRYSWCFAEQFHRISLDRFVRMTYEATTQYDFPDGQYDELENLNPYTGKPFKNILELRKYRLQNVMNISSLVQNYVIVRLEDVQEDPDGFLTYLADCFHVKRTPKLVPIDGYKGSNVPYTPSHYDAIDPKTVEFINNEIDWDVENDVGYVLKEIVPSI